jgi:hypothetical protein
MIELVSFEPSNNMEESIIDIFESLYYYEFYYGFNQES